MEAAGETRALDLACWACGAPAVETEAFGDAAGYACRSCGLAFQPHRSRDELREAHGADYFEAYGSRPYTADEAARRHEASVRLRLVKRYCAAGRLLEIGSAAGYFLQAAHEAGFGVTGVEPSADMVRAAEGRLGGGIIASGIENATLDPRSYDVACAWHVLEHLIEPLGALELVRRSLRRGGYLLVEVPNAASNRARREGQAWAPLDPAHHVAHYTPEALGALLLRAGFASPDLVTVPWAVYRPWPRSLLSHLRQAPTLRGWPAGTHPRKHELMRAAASVPA